MAHFDAHLRYSAAYAIKQNTNTRQRTKAEISPEGVESGKGCARSLPGKFFDDLILKWHILMHISGIQTYLF